MTTKGRQWYTQQCTKKSSDIPIFLHLFSPGSSHLVQIYPIRTAHHRISALGLICY